MKKLKKPKAGTTASGLKSQASPSSMPVFLVQNQKVHSSNKRSCSGKNTRMPDLSLTLPRDLTKIDEDLEPFWNGHSTAIHYTLWQPHQIELCEAGLLLSSGLSNYRVGESSFWKNQILENNSRPKRLSLSLPASSTPITESEAQSVITSKKIRIYPQNEKLWFETLNLFRRAYNLTLEFMRKGCQPHSDFRTQICGWCLIECEEN